jgi:hypothetical protein
MTEKEREKKELKRRNKMGKVRAKGIKLEGTGREKKKQKIKEERKNEYNQ